MPWLTLGGVASALALMAAGSESGTGPPAPRSFGRALSEETARWQRGRDLFTREWNLIDGLGAPVFTARSCATCHNSPSLGGSGGNEFNVLRFEEYDLCDVDIDADVQTARAVGTRGMFGEGVRARWERQTPSLVGLGLIDTIPESEILKLADPEDRDGDLVRGVARRVHGGVGRFGWKASASRLEDFVCMALGDELGLTVPNQGRGFGLAGDTDCVADPELKQEDLEALVSFVRALAPHRSDPAAVRTEHVDLGAYLFERAGCAACHTPVLMGELGPVRLYSDLLLHTVGREGMSLPFDEPRGFRTPPLWGAGETAPYMHDGRAATLREAILLHDGEAIAAREFFESLDQDRQQTLIEFLEGL